MARKQVKLAYGTEMAKEFVEPVALTSESLALVKTINDILDEYSEQGYDLSLRQVYYQLVARNVVPNEEKSYKRVGAILSDARLAGLVDWDMIVDRGRECGENSHWNGPAEIIETCSKQFRYDTWADQPWHVEVMVEKQALQGVLEPVCRRLDIPFTANKGYSSSSAMREAGKRIKERLDGAKDICVIYLGDHDPSGIDMTRDVTDRLMLFSSYEFWAPSKDEDEDTRYFEKALETHNPRYWKQFRNAAYLERQFIVDRIALNMDQIDEFQPPPNPAKVTDSRASKYIEQFGSDSWELDALEPSLLASLLERAVAARRDDGLYRSAVARQEKSRKDLAKASKHWDNQVLKALQRCK